MVDTAGGVSRTIHRTSILAGAFGAVLSPIPLIDEVVLMPVYTMMTARIAKARGVALRAVPWKAITKTTIGGLAARGVVNLSVAFIPGVAAVANAVTAAALTEIIGRYVDRVCEDSEAQPLAVKDITTMLRQRVATATARTATAR
jgi:uncharacterized protein (DUF697 family)